MAEEHATTEPWTVGRLLNWTTDFLRGKGADSPRLDAEILLAHARGCQRIELYTAFDTEPPEAERSEFRELVSRRAKGTPVAYLVGYREFFSLEFEVTPNVLIPRPETEQLVVRALDLVKEIQSADPIQIADVGTGSGNIAVCVAKHCPNCQIMAIDVSPAALDVARRNAERHGVSGRIEFLEGDLLTPLAASQRFDMVLSNPPYVADHELAELPPDVRDHEPRLALDGGAGGTEVVERLIPQAAERILSGGWLLMEVGAPHATQVENLLSESVDFERYETIADVACLPRVVQAQRK